MAQKVVIALGGNAIQSKGDTGTFTDMYKNVYKTMVNLVDLIKDPNYELVITHGNGPQVGTIMLQNAAAKEQAPEMPMFACGAMTQGQIGLLIQQALQNILAEQQLSHEVATIITQTEVDENDPAFANPSKPVGVFYSQAESEAAAQKTGFTYKEDAGRGYRRVVPSPAPINIVEIGAIRKLAASGVMVVASGGGGIPVVKENDQYRGVDAVIDKDKAAALMGDLLQADRLIILTAVAKVALNYGQPNEEYLAELTVTEAQKYLAAGHFAAGSMGPKIEAVIDFLSKNPKRQALITSPDSLPAALKHQDGTWIKA